MLGPKTVVQSTARIKVNHSICSLITKLSVQVREVEGRENSSSKISK